jgi:hypothetical protein
VLFRSIGGAVGVALFGAIFASAFHRQLMHVLPPDAAAAVLASPSTMRGVAAGLRADTVDAFSSALHLVFLIAALIAAFAFVLSFFLREMPLRRTVAAAHRQGEDQRA